jgi:hypothetical protein
MIDALHRRSLAAMTCPSRQPSGVRTPCVPQCPAGATTHVKHAELASRKVDHEVVDAHFLEGQAVVAAGLHVLLDRLFLSGEHRLQPLDC